MLSDQGKEKVKGCWLA